jgi:thiol-disulfide isomerase/thioredoxin
LANFGQNLSARWEQKQGFFGGVAIGALVGLIWTPCAGPIMAAALVQIVQAKEATGVALTVTSFALGAGIPMLAIALMGRQVMSKFGFLKTHSYAVRRALGVIIIAAAVLIWRGADVELLAATASPPFAPASMPVTTTTPVATGGLRMALDQPYPAPEITGVYGWINSPPLKIADLRGKVVLIDFWTYSCINCVRTLPYIISWDQKYRDKGLVIIGVHAPEFAFEKKEENVRAAVEHYGIKYPVTLDSDLMTWSNFHNEYWPAHYLIDKDGRVVYTHFGEGEYDVTEGNIRYLLGLDAEGNKAASISMPSISQLLQTPETYLGYERAEHFANEDEAKHGETVHYQFPSTLLLNHWALQGDWRVDSEKITTQKAGAALRLNFIARKVFLVLGTKDGTPAHVHINLNSKPVGKAGGADVKDGLLTVDSERLYELIDQGSAGNGVLELQTDDAGLQAYAFTFGN